MGGYAIPSSCSKVKDLCVLALGALPAPLKKSFETQVGATMVRIPSTRPSLHDDRAIAVVLFYAHLLPGGWVHRESAMVLNMLFMVAILAAFEAR